MGCLRVGEVKPLSTVEFLIIDNRAEPGERELEDFIFIEMNSIFCLYCLCLHVLGGDLLVLTEALTTIPNDETNDNNEPDASYEKSS